MLSDVEKNLTGGRDTAVHLNQCRKAGGTALVCRRHERFP